MCNKNIMNIIKSTMPKRIVYTTLINVNYDGLRGCGQCGCGFVPQTHFEKLAAMLVFLFFFSGSHPSGTEPLIDW